jgi:hypothetical protein|tara:strand:- start:1219 stop:1401 length:183 start_codon:yes stop_codon:yes gene_type:complete
MIKKEKSKKHDGITRPFNEAYKNGWNEIYLNRILKKEVEIGANGTQGYMIKHGKNKGTIL